MLFLPCVSNGEAIDIVYFFDSNTEIAIKDCNLWRTCNKLDESVHLVLIKLLDDTPEPFYYWRLFRVALVFYFIY